jgi:hypothetical protein
LLKPWPLVLGGTHGQEKTYGETLSKSAGASPLNETQVER